LEKGLELCAPNPEKEDAVIITDSTTPTPTKEPKTAKQFLKRIHPKKPANPATGYAHPFFHNNNNNNKFHNPLPETNAHALLQQIDTSQVLNLKEYFCFNLLPNTPQHQQPQTQHPQPTPKKQSNAPPHTQNSLSYLSEDIFNKVCDQIIDKITQIPVQDTAKWFASFRDALYSILICNLDASECI